MEDDIHTLGLIREVASKLVEKLNLTVDCSAQNEDGRCPVLDFKVWLKETRTEQSQGGK